MPIANGTSCAFECVVNDWPVPVPVSVLMIPSMSVHHQTAGSLPEREDDVAASAAVLLNLQVVPNVVGDIISALSLRQSISRLRAALWT